MKTNMPLVTVIMPVYNAAPYLEKSVRSVLEQSLADFELILVDDGSKDGSPAIVDAFAKADGRVAALHQKNSGVSAARNAGLERARGVYTAFLDSDDVYHKDFLEKMTIHAKADGCQLVSCNFEPFGVENPPKVRTIPETVCGRNEAMAYLLGYNSFNGYVWNKLFLTELIRQHGLQFEAGYPACEDALFAGKYLSFCEKVKILEERLYDYRQNQTGANRGRYAGAAAYDPKWMSVFEMTAYFSNCYAEKSVRQACRKHDVREAGIVLRSMAASGYQGKEYRELKKLLRKYVFLFCSDKNSSYFQKLSVCLSAISPKLELQVWRMRNRKGIQK